MKKKVQGSQVGEVEVEGLREARRGTDEGVGKPKTLHGQIPSKESRNPDPYPNKKRIVKEKYGDIEVTTFGDDAARKRFRDEQ